MLAACMDEIPLVDAKVIKVRANGSVSTAKLRMLPGKAWRMAEAEILDTATRLVVL